MLILSWISRGGKISGPCYHCHVVAMIIGQGFLSGSPSFSLYNVDYPDFACTVALRSEHTLTFTHTPGRSQKKRPFLFFVCFSFSLLLFLSFPPQLLSTLCSFTLFVLSLAPLPSRPLSLLLTCVCVCVRAIRPFSIVITPLFIPYTCRRRRHSTTTTTKPWILPNARSSLYIILHPLPSWSTIQRTMIIL